MAKLKQKSGKSGLLGRMRKQRLRYIAILPSLITMLNGIFGFSAIVLASRGEFVNAGYIILLAMIADMLDGRVARMSQSTSSFGGQLDSLCDMVSFGLAPAILMLKVLEERLSGFAESGLLVENLFEQFVWLCGAVYVCCAAIRLARFNVENEESEAAHMSFIGLPSPAAAGVLVSLVIFKYETLGKIFGEGSWVYVFFDGAIVYLLPVLLLCSGLLMVSRVHYPHLMNRFLRGKKPLAYLIVWLLVIWMVFWWRQAALVLCFCGFAFFGVIRWFYQHWFAGNDKGPVAVEVGVESDLPADNAE